jgi:hypothetical protein
VGQRQAQQIGSFAAAMLLACGGGGSPPPAASALVEGAYLNAATGECLKFRMSPADLEDARQESCTRGCWGTWVGACPSENRLGVCGIDAAEGLVGHTWYPGWLSSVDEARAACALLQGTFVAGTGAASTPSQRRFACDRRAPSSAWPFPVEDPLLPRGACTDLDAALTAEFVTALQFYCEYFGGAPLAAGAACPTAGRVGTCRPANFLVRGLPVNARYYEAAGARGACSDIGGTWTDG